MFKSKAQRRFLWNHHPDIARKWEEELKEELPDRAHGRSIEERIRLATEKGGEQHNKTTV